MWYAMSIKNDHLRVMTSLNSRLHVLMNASFLYFIIVFQCFSTLMNTNKIATDHYVCWSEGYDFCCIP